MQQAPGRGPEPGKESRSKTTRSRACGCERLISGAPLAGASLEAVPLIPGKPGGRRWKRGLKEAGVLWVLSRWCSRALSRCPEEKRCAFVRKGEAGMPARWSGGGSREKTAGLRGWGSGHRQREAAVLAWVRLIHVSFSPFPSSWFFKSSFAPFPAIKPNGGTAKHF